MKPEATYTFPPGFMWGTATSAHQVEGQNSNNNWAAWEAEPGHIHQNQKAGNACGWWAGRWREDFDRAADSDQNAHRLSVEWSRIQPTPDRWDEEAIDRYRLMLRGLMERNLMPMVTLHHFTDPLWFVERGGWENPEAPELFAKFVTKIVTALKEYVTLWVTINEPNVYAYGGWLGGGFPPGKNDSALAGKVLYHLLLTHAAAYKVIHKIQPQARVGVAHQYRGFWPARSWMPLDGAAANLLSTNFNNAFPQGIAAGKYSFLFKTVKVPEALNTQDYFGLNYYTADTVKFSLLESKNFFNKRYFPPDAIMSETGFLASLPQGMFDALKWAKGYGLPIIITENGVEDSQDTMRPGYLLEHLQQVWKAVGYNWMVKGYFHWSLVDNFEWERGWSQRFGLWELDVETQKRTPRPSSELYAAICRENAFTTQLVEQYAPESFHRMFPV